VARRRLPDIANRRGFARIGPLSGAARSVQKIHGDGLLRRCRSLLSRSIDTPLTPQRIQFSLLTLVVARFSLISRCTHRAHGAF
jgi:hypothetical protein